MTYIEAEQLNGICVCVCVRVRACVRACVREMHYLQIVLMSKFVLCIFTKYYVLKRVLIRVLVYV